MKRYDKIWYDAILYHIVWYYFIRWNVIWYNMISYHIVSYRYYIISDHVIWNDIRKRTSGFCFFFGTQKKEFGKVQGVWSPGSRDERILRLTCVSQAYNTTWNNMMIWCNIREQNIICYNIIEYNITY